MNKQRIEEKLSSITDYVEQLEEMLPKQFKEYEKDNKVRFACERLFELTAENLLDVCYRIISEKGNEK